MVLHGFSLTSKPSDLLVSRELARYPRNWISTIPKAVKKVMNEYATKITAERGNREVESEESAKRCRV